MRSSTRNISQLAWVSGICLFLASGEARAATYYVSPSGSSTNPGTLAAPWSIRHAAGSAPVSPGDIVIILDGIYAEGELYFNKSGTQQNPVIYRAQNKHQAEIRSTSTNMAISISASWVTLEGIRLTSGSSAPPQFASSVGIRCWETNKPSPSNPSTGNVGCTVRDVRIDDMPNMNIGFKSNQDYALVENSEIRMGIEALNNFGTVIRNNIAYSKVNGYQSAGIFGKGGVRDMQIHGNIVHIMKPDDMGIILGGYTGDPWIYARPNVPQIEAYNSVAHDNVVINEASQINAPALGMMGAQDSAFFNNIVIGGQIWMEQVDTHASAVNPTWKNNIIHCRGGAATRGAAVGYSYNHGFQYTGTLSLDYNHFFDCVSGVPSQAHPITGDPKFVNLASDWHLQAGSPALGSGIPAAFTGYTGAAIDVSKDFTGTTRTVPWDLGIYDTGSAPPMDSRTPDRPRVLRVR